MLIFSTTQWCVVTVTKKFKTGYCCGSAQICTGPTRFPSNTEAFVSELLENLKNIFLQYYMHSNKVKIYKHPSVCCPYQKG